MNEQYTTRSKGRQWKCRWGWGDENKSVIIRNVGTGNDRKGDSVRDLRVSCTRLFRSGLAVTYRLTNTTAQTRGREALRAIPATLPIPTGLGNTANYTLALPFSPQLYARCAKWRRSVLFGYLSLYLIVQTSFSLITKHHWFLQLAKNH